MLIIHAYFFFFQISICIFVPGTEHICNFATVRGLHRQSTILHGTFDTRKDNALTSMPIVLFIGMQPLYCQCLICTSSRGLYITNKSWTHFLFSVHTHFWGCSCQWRHIRYVTCRFLMVFLCLLLSIFSTIRELQEVSSLVLYYLVSKSVVYIVHGGMNFTPIVHCFTNLSLPWKKLITARIRRMGEGTVFSLSVHTPTGCWGLDGCPPVKTGSGYPPSRTRWGTPHPGPHAPPPGQETDQHSEHLLRGGWYASCVHAGGLSCLLLAFRNNEISLHF